MTILEEPIEIVLDGKQVVKYPAGTRYLDLHLNGETVRVQDGQMTEVFELLKESTEDAEQLLAALKSRKKLKNVKFLAGVTNLQCANFATDSQKFHVITNAYQSWLSRKFIGDTIAVYITAEELEQSVARSTKIIKRIEKDVYD